MSDDIKREKLKAAVSNYRKNVRRFDYAPSPEAREVIERHMAAGVYGSIAKTLDDLVIAGGEVLSSTGHHA